MLQSVRSCKVGRPFAAAVPTIHALRTRTVLSSQRTRMDGPSQRITPSATSNNKAAASKTVELAFDPAGYIKYAAAIPTQVAFMTGALWLLQQACNALTAGAVLLPEGVAGDEATKVLVTLFFLTVAIKSRIFSPLDASRPNIKGERGAIAERRRPSWMPPPLTFPIVWTTIGILRAVSSVMVWEACGRDLVCTPIIIMMLHLSIGDAWNHCNNVQRNLGMAVPGVVLGCLGSGIFVTAAYYQANPTAGLVLSPMCVWLSIASLLVYSIWEINPDENVDGALY